jgi:hypothetical protein
MVGAAIPELSSDNAATDQEIQQQRETTGMIRPHQALASLAAATIWSTAAPAMAAPTVASGQIDTIFAAQGTNYAFRVYLTGGAPLCAGGNGWAYTNVSDDNYKVYVSTLTTAYALGKPINLTVELANGQCHILEVGIRSN